MTSLLVIVPRAFFSREDDFAHVDEPNALDQFGLRGMLRLAIVEELEPVVGWVLAERVVIARKARLRWWISRFLGRNDHRRERFDELRNPVDPDLLWRRSEFERVIGPQDQIGVILWLEDPNSV